MEKTTDIIKLEAIRWEWSQRIFDEATAESSLTKAKIEIKEIEADLESGNPKADEYADAIMCIFDSAERAGLTATEVMDAYCEKIRVNIFERTWRKNPDNTYSHIKTPCQHDFVFVGSVGSAHCHKCGQWDDAIENT